MDDETVLLLQQQARQALRDERERVVAARLEQRELIRRMNAAAQRQTRGGNHPDRHRGEEFSTDE